MRKLLLTCLPVPLTDYNAFSQLVEHVQTAALEYQCDGRPLTVKLDNPRQKVSLICDNRLLYLKQGISTSGVRYTNEIYVFWSKGDEATAYKRGCIVSNNCQLQSPQR